MPSIEIEYPLPNAQLGLSFPAGGTYNLGNFRPRLLVSETIAIRCRLYGGSPVALITTSSDYVVPSPPPLSDDWSVTFNLQPGSYTNCTLKAYFVRNGTVQEPEAHQVEGISASSQTGGMLVVTFP